MTGEEYRESLRDGRETFIDGEQVKDITEDERFRVPIDWVARTYDRYHGTGKINPMLEPPRTAEDMRERVEMLLGADIMIDVTYQSLMTVLTAAGTVRKTNPEYADRILAYVDEAAERDIRVSECITDAKGDRSLPPSRQEDPDAYVRVVDRGEDGIVIRGAKLHITGASLGHDMLVMPTKSMKPGEEDYAVTCAVPVNSPGVKIVNVSYGPREEDARHYPFSSREHMPDGFVIFEDVFVPNERVFLDGQVEHSARFAHSLGLWERLGGITYMTEQADLLVGLAQLTAEANGLARVSHIRDKIAEMLIHATNLRAGLEAALKHAETTDDGFCFPNELFTNAAKYQAASNYHLMCRHLHDIAGGAVTTAPSVADLENPMVGPLVRKYMTTGDDNGEFRSKLFHAIRDLTAHGYGGWNYVANVQSGGGLIAQRLVSRKHYDMERAKSLALKAIEGPEE